MAVHGGRDHWIANVRAAFRDRVLSEAGRPGARDVVRLIRDWLTGRVGERTRLVGRGLPHLLEEAGGLRREEAKRPFARVDSWCSGGGKNIHAAKLPGTQVRRFAGTLAHWHAAKQGHDICLEPPKPESGRLNGQ